MEAEAEAAEVCLVYEEAGVEMRFWEGHMVCARVV